MKETILSVLELNKKRQSDQTDNATHTTTRLYQIKSLSNAYDLHEHQRNQALVKRELLVPFQTKELLPTVRLGGNSLGLFQQTQNKSWRAAHLSRSPKSCI